MKPIEIMLVNKNMLRKKYAAVGYSSKYYHAENRVRLL